MIDAFARILTDVALDVAADEDWPELRGNHDAADDRQSDYCQEDALGL